MTTPNDLHDTLDRVLEVAVRRATGDPNARPRPGQSALAHDTLTAMVGSPGGRAEWSRTQVAGQAPTGVGKSLAALAPAMLMAAVRGERTVVATESLTLQAQYVDKDAPTVAAACQEVLGSSPSVAVVKGWSNYVCLARATSTAAKVTGVDSGEVGPEDIPRLRSAAASTLASGSTRRTRPQLVDLDHARVPTPALAPMLDWALGEAKDAGGDRNAYPGDGHASAWEAVSTSPDGCIGASNCPFGSVCLPEQARTQAAEADIVVTNHAMLAVQAAVGAPVLLGNRRLGTFRHLVVDEAHALPSAVRSQGASTVDAARIERASRAVEKVLASGPGEGDSSRVKALTDSAAVLADRLDVHLGREKSRYGPRAGTATVPADTDPLATIGDQIVALARQARKLLPPRDLTPGRYPVSSIQRVRRAHAALDTLVEDTATARTHELGIARWVEDGPPAGRGRFAGVSVKTSPVDVSGLLRSGCWTATALDDSSSTGNQDDGETVWSVPEHEWSTPPDPATRTPPRYEMSVTCMSATLGAAFVFDAGMAPSATAYPSPFEDAYGSSVLYVPRVGPGDMADLTSNRFGRERFDTQKHPQWALGPLTDLIEANGGSALVLAATVTAGKAYAAHLRARPGLAVHSQWDGPPVRALIADWTADVGSVMVGTRSLMTGVDAAGPTCSLVVIDRVPRSAGNPVDDARVEAVTDRTGMDKWAADRLVYVADATLLLEQAAGRLIRSVDDRGMVACLDPRLLKSAPRQIAYQATTRSALMAAFARFQVKTADRQTALQFLSGSQVRAA